MTDDQTPQNETGTDVQPADEAGGDAPSGSAAAPDKPQRALSPWSLLLGGALLALVPLLVLGMHRLMPAPAVAPR